MATLVEDIFLRLLYMVYPEVPMILLANKATQAIVPVRRQNALGHLRTAQRFYQHDRTTFVRELAAWDDQIKATPLYPPVIYFRDGEPFSLLLCWKLWRALVNELDQTSGVERHFYDNLVFWLFRHCVLTCKTHLIGKSGSLVFTDYMARWMSCVDPGWRYDPLARAWAWPSSCRHLNEAPQASWLTTRNHPARVSPMDVVAVQFKTLPTAYIAYCIEQRGDVSVILPRVFAHKIGPNGEDSVIPVYYPYTGPIYFTRFNNVNMHIPHEKYIAKYLNGGDVSGRGEYRTHASFTDYKDRVVEDELVEYGGQHLRYLLSFHGRAHGKTPEALVKETLNVEHTKQLATYDLIAKAIKNRDSIISAVWERYGDRVALSIDGTD